MKIITADNLSCPIDGERLISQQRQLVCGNGHSFDLARQGYVNLLPVQHKRTRHPGDSKEMVLARSRFLNSGIYAAIADKLALLSYSYLEGRATSCVLDAGCGEGYYLDSVLNYLKNKNDAADVSFIGLDISKQAIVEAAKRNKQISWLVGTNRQPPVASDSIDIIVCVFGFQSFEGFNKILKPGGKVILVEPGPDHLIELREIIYSTVKRTPIQDPGEFEALGFLLLESQPLQLKTGRINNKMINDLLLMTPHFYRASNEGRQAAMQLQTLELSMDVVFRVFEKNKSID